MARFAQWLDVTMMNRGIKGSDLADKIGVHGSAISRWRTGQSIPGMETCVKLAKALRVDPGRLAVTAGQMPLEVAEAAGIEPLPTPPPVARRDRIIRQLETIKGVSPELKQKLLETLDEALDDGHI